MTLKIAPYICHFDFAARKEHKRRHRYHDNRLSKREFRDFIYKIVELMGGSENFDFFVEFLLNSVEVGAI